MYIRHKPPEKIALTEEAMTNQSLLAFVNPHRKPERRLGIILEICANWSEAIIPNTVSTQNSFTRLIPCPRKAIEISTESNCLVRIIQLNDNGPRILIAE